MRSIAVILVCGIVTGAVLAQDAEPGSPGVGDSLYPGFGNGGYDAQHYTLDLTVEVESGEVQGVTTMDAIATQDLSSFNLDLIGFVVEGVTVNGAAADFSREGQELTITPAEPLLADEPFTAEIAYNGIPEEITSVAIPVLTGWVRYDGGVFVLSEPDGAANFYPVNDHPLDRATYTFRVTVDKPYEVAANGTLEATLDNGDTSTYVFEHDYPMASYLTTVNIGDFDLETDDSHSAPIRNYFAASLDDDYRALFARQGEMLDYFVELFGEYPFDVYGSVVVDTEAGSALETQTLSIFGVDMLDLEDADYSEQLVTHELAHQWFGDSVSLADWGDIWLNEGFATYAEALWVEHLEGRSGLQAWVRDTYKYVVEGGADVVPPGEPHADDLFNDGVYYRAALLLHALRERVGDEPFFDMLRTYYDRCRFGSVRTADFIAVVEEVSEQNLDDFFEAWLHDEVTPDIPEMELTAR